MAFMILKELLGKVRKNHHLSLVNKLLGIWQLPNVSSHVLKFEVIKTGEI